ncbi:MAG TPA: DUF2630 family protein [Acetobacteraceae bacterium]|jgi:hypothetical protein|nr:DUF2630 family protein [Acetobacteraceae bacterium]
MASETSDQNVLDHIQRLVAEEDRIMAQRVRSDADLDRLKTLGVALDQAWDLLRQRRALREFGHDPSEARVRPPEVVEKYLG